MAYSCCFSKRENIDFLDFDKKHQLQTKFLLLQNSFFILKFLNFGRLFIASSALKVII